MGSRQTGVGLAGFMGKEPFVRRHRGDRRLVLPFEMCTRRVNARTPGTIGGRSRAPPSATQPNDQRDLRLQDETGELLFQCVRYELKAFSRDGPTGMGDG